MATQLLTDEALVSHVTLSHSIPEAQAQGAGLLPRDDTLTPKPPLGLTHSELSPGACVCPEEGGSRAWMLLSSALSGPSSPLPAPDAGFGQPRGTGQLGRDRLCPPGFQETSGQLGSGGLNTSHQVWKRPLQRGLGSTQYQTRECR